MAALCCSCFGGPAAAATPPPPGPPAAHHNPASDIIVGGPSCRRLSLCDLAHPVPSVAYSSSSSSLALSRGNLSGGGALGRGLSRHNSGGGIAAASVSAPSFVYVQPSDVSRQVVENPLRRVSLPLQGLTPRSDDEIQQARLMFSGLLAQQAAQGARGVGPVSA